MVFCFQLGEVSQTPIPDDGPPTEPLVCAMRREAAVEMGLDLADLAQGIRTRRLAGEPAGAPEEVKTRASFSEGLSSSLAKSSSTSQRSGRKREAFVEGGDFGFDLCEDACVFAILEGFMNPGGDLGHFWFLHSTSRDRWRTDADASTESDFFGVEGDTVLVDRDPCFIERFRGDLAVEPAWAEIHQHEVIVRPARDDAVAVGGESGGQGLGVLDDLLGVVRKAWL